MHLLRYLLVLLGFILPSGVICLRSQTVDSFNPFTNGYVRSLNVQGDGQILVGGSFKTWGGQSREFVGRLDCDGTLDTNFNPNVHAYSVLPIALQEDGKILMGGVAPSVEEATFLGRFNPDGTPDTNFNQHITQEDGIVVSMVLQEDGKILVSGGFQFLEGQFHFGIGRLNADGTLDTSFPNAELRGPTGFC